MQKTLETLHKIIIVTGHFGSGKTNFAVNLAKKKLAEGLPVTLVDLDIVNPYFRAADNRDELMALGARCIVPEFANTNVDIPTLPPEVYSALEEYERDSDRVTIFDVGGDNGAVALGMYNQFFEKYGCDMIYVASKYRPLTETSDDALAILREIEYYSRLHVSCIVNSSNIGEETTADDIRASLDWADELSKKSGLPILCTLADERIADELSDIPNLLPIKNATNRLY
ncbi:MAG: hypothetical protein HFE63_09465 [Clostridiales bacterium]|nr:hypothetical protein [Clostridiales bacterium]